MRPIHSDLLKSIQNSLLSIILKSDFLRDDYIGDVIYFNDIKYKLDKIGNIYLEGILVGKLKQINKSKIIIESTKGHEGIYSFFDHVVN